MKWHKPLWRSYDYSTSTMKAHSMIANPRYDDNIFFDLNMSLSGQGVFPILNIKNMPLKRL
jgi:hypothetical protein